jgi:hypothetical protein
MRIVVLIAIRVGSDVELDGTGTTVITVIEVACRDEVRVDEVIAAEVALTVVGGLGAAVER